MPIMIAGMGSAVSEKSWKAQKITSILQQMHALFPMWKMITLLCIRAGSVLHCSDHDQHEIEC